MKYIVMSQGGLVTQSGVCQHEHAPAGAVEVPALPEPHSGKTFFLGGSYVYSSEPMIRPSVDMSRRLAYPDVGDQLGAIWKAIAPLIEHPEAEAVLARIQAVKDANPKG